MSLKSKTLLFKWKNKQSWEIIHIIKEPKWLCMSWEGFSFGLLSMNKIPLQIFKFVFYKWFVEIVDAFIFFNLCILAHVFLFPRMWTNQLTIKNTTCTYGLFRSNNKVIYDFQKGKWSVVNFGLKDSIFKIKCLQLKSL